MIKEFIIVTGLSGAGKSSALRIFEDFGFFCIDNLPPLLMPKFAELITLPGCQISKVALVSDVRGGLFFDDLFPPLKDLKRMGLSYKILFLEATNEILIRRYKESRRRHPLSSLSDNGSLSDDIENEKAKLRGIRNVADRIIDTSNLSSGELKAFVGDWLKKDPLQRMHINTVSFGYKYGLPLDTDLVFDVRFLPNPYWDKDLRLNNGTERVIQDYLKAYPITDSFMNKLLDFCDFLIPNYITEGKSQLSIAVGCTGGKHRSVAIAIWLTEALKEEGYLCSLTHRDMDKDKNRES